MQHKTLRGWIKEHLDKGYIKPSNSPTAAGFFWVPKKNTTEERPTLDYRALNSITQKDSYPLPLISEVVEHMADNNVFTKLDIRWGFNNIWIKAGDE